MAKLKTLLYYKFKIQSEDDYIMVKVIDEFRGKYFFLSNFYNAKVTFNGITYENNESAFQAQKQPNIAYTFAHLNPSQAKSKGRRVTLRYDWEVVKDDIMWKICYSKFAYNDDLKEKLLATGDAVLVEGNTWNDTYWGVCKGKGKNHLGKILMEVREALREELSAGN